MSKKGAHTQTDKQREQGFTDKQKKKVNTSTLMSKKPKARSATDEQEGKGVH